MDSLLWKGFKRPLSSKDLWDFIPSVILPWLILISSSTGTRPTLHETPSRHTSHHISHYPPYLILFVSSPEVPLWKGIAISLLLLGNKVCSTFFIARYFFYMVTVGMKLKTSVTSLIYRKSLKIHSTRDDITSGEIVNLMSVDVKKIEELMTLLNTICRLLAYNTLGYSALAGVSVMILLIPINGVIAKKDERVKKMNEILQGMKIIKLYGWEPSFAKLVSSIRLDEINLLKTSAKYFSLMMLTISSTTFFISLNNVLDSEKIFVSISLFNILRFPLNMLTHVIGGIASASVSLKRINSFLATEELEEGILIRSNTKDPHAIVVPPKSTFSWRGSQTPLFKN
ncbi:ATP-binding cassette sub-family C member 1, partial [Caligus rogercresseyi]